MPSTHHRASGTGTPICHAPFSSMYLDPVGDVRACCQNRWHRLGNIGRDRLVDIWRGPAADELRRRMLDGDLSLGCELCAAEVRRGDGSNAFFEQFADLGRDEVRPEWPLQLELALSIACNLQCVMCNGDLSSSIRAHREQRPALVSPYGDEFFAQLDDFLPHLRRIMFLGGEPFLGHEALRVMDRLVELELRPRCVVTTNGTQWNDRVRRVLDSLPMDVFVSVDGASDEVIRSIRRGTDRRTLVENIDHYLDTTRRSGSILRLTFCLMEPNWHELGAVLEWGDRLDVDVQINDVTHPPSLSLLHSPLHVLEDVVAGLREEDGPRRRSLGRNRHVWERETRRLVSVLDARRAGVVEHDDVASSARALAGRAGSSPVHELTVDGSNVIRRIAPDPADVLGVDVTGCVGRSASSFLDTLMLTLGSLVRSDLVQHPDGVEERTFVLRGTDGRTTEVKAAMAPDGDGERWFVASSGGGRGSAPGATPVTLQPSSAPRDSARA